MKKKHSDYWELALRKGVEIDRDDNILSLPNRKYINRFLLHYPEVDEYFIVYHVYDMDIEYCYHSVIKKFKYFSEAEIVYLKTYCEAMILYYQQ